MAQVRDYNPRALFERINSNRSGKITANELLRFLKENYIKDTSVEQCQEIIGEYDSTQDGLLQYDEFLNIFLPAANLSLRDYCLYGARVPSYYTDPKRPLPISVTTMAVRILEREKTMIDKRSECRRDLFKHIDHQKLKTFNDITRGQTLVLMSDLIFFLEENGFCPKTEDIEAILRRCDHDADQALSFEEFCELTELPGGNDDEEEVGDDQSIDQKANVKSPIRKEMKQSVEQSK